MRVRETEKKERQTVKERNGKTARENPKGREKEQGRERKRKRKTDRQRQQDREKEREWKTHKASKTVWDRKRESLLKADKLKHRLPWLETERDFSDCPLFAQHEMCCLVIMNILAESTYVFRLIISTTMLLNINSRKSEIKHSKLLWTVSILTNINFEHLHHIRPVTYSARLPHDFNDLFPQSCKLIKRFLALILLVVLKLHKGQGLCEVKVNQGNAWPVTAGAFCCLTETLDMDKCSLQHLIGYKQRLVENGPVTEKSLFPEQPLVIS